MARLVYSKKALEDLESILCHVTRDNPGAAVRFVEEVIACCELIAANPGMGTRREDVARGIRVFSFRGYGVWFRSTETGVRIQRVLHGARDVGRQRFD